METQYQQECCHIQRMQQVEKLTFQSHYVAQWGPKHLNWEGEATEKSRTDK